MGTTLKRMEKREWHTKNETCDRWYHSDVGAKVEEQEVNLREYQKNDKIKIKCRMFVSLTDKTSRSSCLSRSRSISLFLTLSRFSVEIGKFNTHKTITQNTPKNFYHISIYWLSYNVVKTVRECLQVSDKKKSFDKWKSLLVRLKIIPDSWVYGI